MINPGFAGGGRPHAAQAASAGGQVTAPSHARPWGVYSGYFMDPDGHLWEVRLEPSKERVIHHLVWLHRVVPISYSRSDR
jgi:hypothetical protein